MKIDVSTPIGTPMMIAPAVTTSEPTIIGKIPNDGLEAVGRHTSLKMKSPIPSSIIKGTPPSNIK